MQYTYVHKDLILSVWGCIICQEVYVCTYINACMYGLCIICAYILHICMYRCVHMYVHVRMYGRTTTHLFESTSYVLLEVVMKGWVSSGRDTHSCIWCWSCSTNSFVGVAKLHLKTCKQKSRQTKHAHTYVHVYNIIYIHNPKLSQTNATWHKNSTNTPRTALYVGTYINCMYVRTWGQ